MGEFITVNDIRWTGGREGSLLSQRLGPPGPIETKFNMVTSPFHIYRRPPDIIHVMNAPRPSRSSASVYYCQHKLKTEKRVGLGTRLAQLVFTMQSFWLSSCTCVGRTATLYGARHVWSFST